MLSKQATVIVVTGYKNGTVSYSGKWPRTGLSHRNMHLDGINGTVPLQSSGIIPEGEYPRRDNYIRGVMGMNMKTDLEELRMGTLEAVLVVVVPLAILAVMIDFALWVLGVL